MADEEIPDWAKEKTTDAPEWARGAAKDAPFDLGRTAKQLPLGILRGATSPFLASLGAAQLNMENLTDSPAPTPEQFRPAMQQITEGENAPANPYERAASAVGESLPLSAALAPTPANIGIGVAGAIGGSAAGELFDKKAGVLSEKNKPYGEIAGSLVSSLGAAGALRLANGILNMFRPYRTLGGTAEEFKIPATKGMISGEAPQIAEEQAMERGARGHLAQNIMVRQRQATEEARRRVEAGMTEAIGGATTPAEAAEIVTHGLRTRSEDYRSAGDALYESAKAKNAWAVTDTHSPITLIDDALVRSNVRLDEINYPSSQSAMRLIQKHLQPGTAIDAIGTSVDEMGPRVLSVRQMEEVRHGLRALRASHSQPEDARALSHIKRAYDDWENQTVQHSLFVGDKTAIDDIRKARPLWRRYREMVDSDPKKDYTRVIADIIGKDRTNDQVANWLLSTSSIDQAGRASRTARFIKKAFGGDSEEWQALRQGLLFKAINPSGEKQGAAATAKAIENAIDGKASALSRVIFTSEEVARLRRYAEALRKVTPKLDNPSGTSYGNARFLWGIITGTAGAAAVATSYHTGDYRWMALGALPFIRDARAAQRALSAVSQTRRAPTGIGGILGGVAPFIPGGQPQGTP